MHQLFYLYVCVCPSACIALINRSVSFVLRFRFLLSFRDGSIRARVCECTFCFCRCIHRHHRCCRVTEKPPFSEQPRESDEKADQQQQQTRGRRGFLPSVLFVVPFFHSSPLSGRLALHRCSQAASLLLLLLLLCCFCLQCGRLVISAQYNCRIGFGRTVCFFVLELELLIMSVTGECG